MHVPLLKLHRRLAVSLRLVFFVLHLSCSGTSHVRAAQIYPSDRIVVQEGQGFLVKLNTEAGFGKVKYCTFLFNGEPYFLHPSNENAMDYVSVNGETVQRFTASECGVKVSNVSLNSAGIWQLGATSSAGHDASAELHLKVTPAVSDGLETMVYGRPGTPVAINCSIEGDDVAAVDSNHRFCEMWQSEKESERDVKWGSCEWKTIHPELGQRTEINCRTFATGSMEAVTRKWIVIGHFSGTTSDYLNSDASVVLRCKSKGPLKGCFVQHQQTGRVLKIGNALKGTRYSSYRTNMARGLCQFEIPKPFRVDELGVWVMRDFTTCLRSPTEMSFKFN